MWIIIMSDNVNANDRCVDPYVTGVRKHHLIILLLNVLFLVVVSSCCHIRRSYTCINILAVYI